MEETQYLRETREGLYLAIKVIPRASRTEIVGLSGPELRIRLTAPPVDEAANRQLMEFLAKRLACPKRNLRLEKGARSRHKLVRLLGTTREMALQRLQSIHSQE